MQDTEAELKTIAAPGADACQVDRRWVWQSAVAAFLGIIVILLVSRGFDPRMTDFRVFYTAAQMIHHGAAHNLYDVAVQQAFQARFVHRLGLLFAFPAATALLYVPGAWLSLQSAYTLWTAESVALLFIASLFLNRALALFKTPTSLFGVTLLFAPIWINLLQGQPVFVLLLAYSLALCFFMDGQEFTAGAALALALFKFHLVLPFVLVLLLRRRWRAITGFSTAAFIFIGVCFATVGWRGMANYPRLLMQVPSLPSWGMNVAFSANLRGLFFGFFHREPPVLVVIGISLALLVWAARLWTSIELGFAISMTVTVLISYHLNPHDLSLLVIPLLVLLKRTPLLSWRSFVLGLLAVPLPFLLIGPHFWLIALAIITLLVALVASAAPSCRQTASVESLPTEPYQSDTGGAVPL